MLKEEIDQEAFDDTGISSKALVRLDYDFIKALLRR